MREREPDKRRSQRRRSRSRTLYVRRPAQIAFVSWVEELAPLVQCTCMQSAQLGHCAVKEPTLKYLLTLLIKASASKTVPCHAPNPSGLWGLWGWLGRKRCEQNILSVLVCWQPTREFVAWKMSQSRKPGNSIFFFIYATSTSTSTCTCCVPQVDEPILRIHLHSKQTLTSYSHNAHWHLFQHSVHGTLVHLRCFSCFLEGTPSISHSFELPDKKDKQDE